MKAIDRVMRAYSRTRSLTDSQQQLVRGELSKFIQELVIGQKVIAEELRDQKDAVS